MSYMLAHLFNGWQVDEAILSEEDRVVVSLFAYIPQKLVNNATSVVLFKYYHNYILQVIRFGHDWDPTCMKMDEVLYNIAEKVKNFAVIYLVDITKVPDFNKM